MSQLPPSAPVLSSFQEALLSDLLRCLQRQIVGGSFDEAQFQHLIERWNQEAGLASLHAGSANVNVVVTCPLLYAAIRCQCPKGYAMLFQDLERQGMDVAGLQNEKGMDLLIELASYASRPWVLTEIQRLLAQGFPLRCVWDRSYPMSAGTLAIRAQNAELLETVLPYYTYEQFLAERPEWERVLGLDPKNALASSGVSTLIRPLLQHHEERLILQESCQSVADPTNVRARVRL